jgi:hypothetical protein
MNFDDLKQEGLDVPLMLAGLLGALMMMSKTAGLNAGRTIFATIGGAASANYLTPLILHITKIGSDPTYSYAIAFLLGFTGLRTIELLTSKFLTDEPINTSKRRR